MAYLGSRNMKRLGILLPSRPTIHGSPPPPCTSINLSSYPNKLPFWHSLILTDAKRGSEVVECLGKDTTQQNVPVIVEPRQTVHCGALKANHSWSPLYL